MSDNVKQFKSKTAVLTTWVTPDVVAALEKRAAEADRSVAAELRRIVRHALDEGASAAA